MQTHNFHHAPADYNCPFCRILNNAKQPAFFESPNDIICQVNQVTAFLSLNRWPHNPLDVLVIPDEHFENIYDLPEDCALPLQTMTRAVSLALKQVYHCDGVSTRQHNEPAGSQDVWHYHIHVIPRFHRDDFYQSRKIIFPETERLETAARLREYMTHNCRALFRTA